MMFIAFFGKVITLSALATMSNASDLKDETSPQAFSLMFNNNENLTVIETVEFQMMEPSISLQNVTPAVDFAVISNNNDNKTIEDSFDPVLRYGPTETLNFSNETFAMKPTVSTFAKMNETLKMETNTAFPVFSLMTSANHIEFESLSETVGNELKPAISLVVGLLESIGSTSEVVREKFTALLGEMSPTLFDAIQATFEPVKDFFDNAFGFEVIHFSSAPMVTGNLTGSAINLGLLDHDSLIEIFLPTTGCTIPAFALDFILEKEVEVFEQAFVEDFLMAPSRRSVSLASGLYDTISVELHYGYKEFETSVSDFLAPSPSSPFGFAGGDMVVKTVSDALEASVATCRGLWSSRPHGFTTGDMVVKTVSEIYIQAYDKMGNFAADLFPPPPPRSPLEVRSRRANAKVRECERVEARVKFINWWLSRPMVSMQLKVSPEVKCVLMWKDISTDTMIE